MTKYWVTATLNFFFIPITTFYCPSLDDIYLEFFFICPGLNKLKSTIENSNICQSFVVILWMKITRFIIGVNSNTIIYNCSLETFSECWLFTDTFNGNWVCCTSKWIIQWTSAIFFKMNKRNYFINILIALNCKDTDPKDLLLGNYNLPGYT